MRIFMLALLLTLISPSAAFCTDPTVPDSPSGFASQYQPLFLAWGKRDSRKLNELLNEFAIPSHWFVDTFGPDEGLQFAKLYADQFEDFELHISRNFEMSAALSRKFVEHQRYGTGAAQIFIATELKLGTDEPKPAPKPAPPSLQPLPGIQKFQTQTRLRVRNEEHDISSWMDSFLYIDGKFRFLGRGGYPFWDAAKVRLADPCAKPGEQTGGKLIKRVEPEYPPLAKDQHIEGIVSARLTVATDGTVLAVEITDGNTALVESARQAFMKWQYTPFMNCGKPVEMRSIEHIKFSLSKRFGSLPIAQTSATAPSRASSKG